MKKENLVYLVYRPDFWDYRPISECPPNVVVDLTAGTWRYEPRTADNTGRTEWKIGTEWRYIRYQKHGTFGVYDRTDDEHLNMMMLHTSLASQDNPHRGWDG